MAGNYPDVPSWRMPYDRDGSQGFLLDSGKSQVYNQLSSAQMIGLNNEDTNDLNLWGGNGIFWIAVIFPELRDLDAICQWVGTTANQPVEVSTDTTNAIDGTWVSAGSAVTATSKTQMRTNIASFTSLGIRAMRIYTGNSYECRFLHLFGEPAPGENVDRLALWHPTEDRRIDPAHFDWGNVPRGSSADKTFRVKNLSPTLTAQSIRVAMEALTDTTPSVPGQHSLSYGGGSFLAQVNIGDLAPGAVSTPVTIRRITPTDAALSLWWFRPFAEAGSWA